MPHTSLDTNLQSAASVNATGSSPAVQNLQNVLDPYVELLIHITTAPTGTSPTLTYSVAVSEDGTNFDTIYTGTALSAVGWTRVLFTPQSTQGPIMEEWIKVTWTAGGTFTTAAVVTSDLIFSNPTEL